MAPIRGTEGDDTLGGNPAGTQLYAYGGNDSVTGAAGADTIYGGSGDDTLSGGAHTDSVFGEDGNDLLVGANDAADFFDGGSGNDTIRAGDSPGDTAFGGTGEDQISGGGGADLIYGEADNDTLTGGQGDDTLVAGSGHDQVQGGAGNDLADLGVGNDSFGSVFLGDETGSDTVWAGGGNDQILGGSGDDRLWGEDGGDLILAGAGADSVDGGVGDDLISGGSGVDTLTGGAGRDVLQLVVADSGDVVADFDLTLAPDGMTTDRLDTSALIQPDGEIVKAWDVAVSDAGGGGALLTFPSGETLILQGVSPALISSSSVLHAMGVPCFAAGTMIETPEGPCPVEALRAGDRVLTAGGRAQPVLWAGGRVLALSALDLRPQDRPVRLAAGVIGNARPLLLSPQHAVAVPGVEGIVRARHLAGRLAGARHARGLRRVAYHHVLLPAHALVRLAGGGLAESFYPGPHALAALGSRGRDEVLAVLLAAGLARSCGEAGGVDLGPYGARCLPLLGRAAFERALAGLGQRITIPPRGALVQPLAAPQETTSHPLIAAARSNISPACPEPSQNSKRRRNSLYLCTPAK